VFAAWAVVGSSWVFPELSANSDEGVYLLQADAIAAGRLAPDAPAQDPEAYLPWFAVVRDSSYVVKYTPVHAAVLAAADVGFGSPRVALAAIAATQVVLITALARELGARRNAALLAAALFVISPIALLLSITFLAYGTSLVLLLATTLAALRAVRRRSRAAAAVAGALWGVATFARPYDGVLVALIVVAGVAFAMRRQVRDLAAPFAWALVGAVAPVVLFLLYNRAATGDLLQLPFTQLDPRDRLGFGLRAALPTDAPLDYTPARAVAALGRNLLLLVAWTGGGLLTCALAIEALARRRLRGGAVLVALLAVWPAGYLLFWGTYLTAYVWDGALFLGPYYYFPMVAALAIAAAVTLGELWRRRPLSGLVAAAGAVVLSAAVAVPALRDQLDRTSQRVAVADAVAANVGHDALVFVPPLYGNYLQNPFSFLRNTAELDGEIVYALDRGDAANRAVQAAHRARTAYRLVLGNGWSDQPGFQPDVRIERLPPIGRHPEREP